MRRGGFVIVSERGQRSAVSGRAVELLTDISCCTSACLGTCEPGDYSIVRYDAVYSVIVTPDEQSDIVTALSLT